MGQLKAQNQDTVLGSFWHLLNPLLLVGVYYLVFGLILDVGGRGADNFVAFLTAGLFTFLFTRKSVQSGAKSIVSNLGLIRSIKFPRAVLPIAAVLGEAIAMVPAVAAMLCVVLLTGESPRFTWLLLPAIYTVQAVFNLGLAFILARATDHFHDIEHILPYTMTIWMYLSGVFYEVDAYIADPTALFIFKLNPAYVFMQLVRNALLGGFNEGRLWLLAVGWALVSIALGFAYFRAREQAYGRA
ncbi:MAG TPA: ABC transporter permease [Dermatophilaceae bacterium]|nr:ABC transporter permease [Dermatophilaceae bacterium]